MVQTLSGTGKGQPSNGFDCEEIYEGIPLGHTAATL